LIKRRKGEVEATSLAKRSVKHEDNPVLRKEIRDLKAEALSPSVKTGMANVAAPSGNEKAIGNSSDQAEGQNSIIEPGAADDFAKGLVRQMVNTHWHDGDKIDRTGFLFMLSVVRSIKPKDQLESMLAAQMAAIHMATMKFAGRLSRVKTIVEQDSIERGLNKLARTYTTQMEVLKRYRTGGEQNITVQHVSVSEGGQAIVGNVTRAAHDTTPMRPENAARALTDARQSAMEIIGNADPAALRRRQKDGG
jgi:hypothetical protein